MSNSLDPEQARRFVGPNLSPNCLLRLSADDNGRQRVNGSNMGRVLVWVNFFHFCENKFLALLFKINITTTLTEVLIKFNMYTPLHPTFI